MKIMTYMACIVMALVTYTALGDTIEELGPVVMTYHPTLPASICQGFSGKLSKNGCLISNYELGLAYTIENGDKFQKFIVFGGTDSVGSNMGGLLYERGYEFWGFDVGFAIGGYLQVDQTFYDKGIAPFQLSSVNGYGIVPIMGLVLDYKIPLSDTTFLGINNILSPVITNSVLSLGWRF